MGLMRIGDAAVKKVWENKNPSNTFSAQTVSLDLSPYKIALVEFVTLGFKKICMAYIGGDTGGYMYEFSSTARGDASAVYVENRGFLVREQGVDFYDGYYRWADGDSQILLNTCAIPTAIYAIR